MNGQLALDMTAGPCTGRPTLTPAATPPCSRWRPPKPSATVASKHSAPPASTA